MMKKLLALALVLGLAGAAHAVISLSPDATTINIGDTVTVSVVSDSSSSYGAWLEPVDNGKGTFGDLMILSAAGADASKDSSFLPWWLFEAKSFNPDAPVQPGAHFTIDFTGTAEGEATLNLWDFDAANVLATSTITVLIPEPLTVSLLGLGGLFLRRRR